jgi:hypothetical protein
VTCALVRGAPVFKSTSLTFQPALQRRSRQAVLTGERSLARASARRRFKGCDLCYRAFSLPLPVLGIVAVHGGAPILVAGTSRSGTLPCISNFRTFPRTPAYRSSGIRNGFSGIEHNPVDYATAVSVPTLVLHGQHDERVYRHSGERCLQAPCRAQPNGGGVWRWPRGHGDDEG